MQVWCQTPQAGVSLLQVCIWTSGLLQSPFPHYHHLCLQAGSPSEPHGGWHDCQQTAPRVVLEHQPLLRCPGMAPLATAPVTGWRQFHPTCRQFWQVPDSPFLVHCRWIPSENQHGLRGSKAAFGMVVRSAIPIAPNPTTTSTIGALTTCTVAYRSNSTYCVIKVSG